MDNEFSYFHLCLLEVLGVHYYVFFSTMGAARWPLSCLCLYPQKGLAQQVTTMLMLELRFLMMTGDENI